MNRMLSLIAGLAVAGALTIGCGGDDDADSATPDDTPDNGGLSLIMPADPISVSDALADDAPEGPLLVRGFLIAVGDEVRLCELLAESDPPQCGGDSMIVDNLDTDAYFQQALSKGDVTWLGEPADILGTVVDGDHFDVRNDILQ